MCVYVCMYVPLIRPNPNLKLSYSLLSAAPQSSPLLSLSLSLSLSFPHWPTLNITLSVYRRPPPQALPPTCYQVQLGKLTGQLGIGKLSLTRCWQLSVSVIGSTNSPLFFWLTSILLVNFDIVGLIILWVSFLHFSNIYFAYTLSICLCFFDYKLNKSIKMNSHKPIRERK